MLAAILTAAVLCAGAVDAIAATGGAPAASGQASSAGEPASAGEPSTSVSKRGVATWFGPGFYGRQTACGQILTREVLGVAHRTLPCGTLVRLSYRGHSMVVPVIDRGPYAHGVTWDLTAAAAHALGVAGTARVRALLVGQVANTPLLGLPPGSPASSATGGNAAG
jgi:rare lipoprotein A (peptidoglycan hydrolase)